MAQRLMRRGSSPAAASSTTSSQSGATALSPTGNCSNSSFEEKIKALKLTPWISSNSPGRTTLLDMTTSNLDIALLESNIYFKNDGNVIFSYKYFAFYMRIKSVL